VKKPTDLIMFGEREYGGKNLLVSTDSTSVTADFQLHACTAQVYRSDHERDLRKSGAGRYLVLSGGLAARRRPRQGVRAGLN